MKRQIRRRRLLGSIGVAASAGVLAGCSTETQDGTEDGGDGGDGDGDGGGNTVEAPSEVSDYLSDTSNFDGNLVDMTDVDEPTVDVGVEANNANNGFGPPAIQISSGTTVVWEWTGQGSHNVVHEEGNFESDITNEEDFTFDYEFGESGTYRYYCTPHVNRGMKGAVVVE